VVTKKEALHRDVVRIVSSRSKPQLKPQLKHSKAIDEVMSWSQAFYRFYSRSMIMF
jgi:hypothetical protein